MPTKKGNAEAAAKEAAAIAAAHRETSAQKRSRIAELQERARLFGDSVKQSAQAKVLERKWLRFLLVYTPTGQGVWSVVEIQKLTSRTTHLL